MSSSRGEMRGFTVSSTPLSLGSCLQEGGGHGPSQRGHLGLQRGAWGVGEKCADRRWEPCLEATARVWVDAAVVPVLAGGRRRSKVDDLEKP